MVWFGHPVLDPVRLADQIEPHGPRIDGVPVSGLLCEPDTVVPQDRVDLVRRRLKGAFKVLPSCLASGFLGQLCHRGFAGAVDGHKEIELAVFGPDLGNVDVE
jgi:hypothetical protein